MRTVGWNTQTRASAFPTWLKTGNCHRFVLSSPPALQLLFSLGKNPSSFERAQSSPYPFRSPTWRLCYNLCIGERRGHLLSRQTESAPEGGKTPGNIKYQWKLEYSWERRRITERRYIIGLSLMKLNLMIILNLKLITRTSRRSQCLKSPQRSLSMILLNIPVTSAISL